MTVIRRNANGFYVKVSREPGTEDDIITPAALAKMVADEVAVQLDVKLSPVRKKFVESIEFAAQTAAERVAQTVVEKAEAYVKIGRELAAGHMAKSAKDADSLMMYAGEKLNASVKALQQSLRSVEATQQIVLNECSKRLVELESAQKLALDRWANRVAGLEARLAEANFQTLKQVIAAEIEQYKLEQLIRDELRQAVRAALSDLRSQPVDATPSPTA